MTRPTRRVLLAAAAVLTVAAVAATTSANASPVPVIPGAGAPLQHIYVIMLENHSQTSVIGDQNAPFINTLAHEYGVADRYYGVTHPSMPNYLATIGGETFGILDDNDQNVVNLDRPNLVDQLEARHLTWDAYFENLPADKLSQAGPTLPGAATVPLYVKKHNPFVLFDDISNSPARMAHIKDYSSLSTDLNGAEPPNFVWISPNQCDDMHGGVYTAVPGQPETPCPYGASSDDVNDAALKQKADAFVHRTVDTIMESKAWTRRSAIVIVADENDFTGQISTGGWQSAAGCCDSPYVARSDPRVSASWPGGTYGGGLVPAIVVTGFGPRHVVSDTPYNHYSLLTTIEDNWALGYIAHGGDTGSKVLPMWDLFLP